MPHWMTQAEAALGGEPTAGVEVIGAKRPPIFDLDGVRALIAPLLAHFPPWFVGVLVFDYN